MVAIFVAVTFIAAIVIDSLLRKGKAIKETVELTSFVEPAVKPVPNVLVVDDENIICSSCKKILTQKGYKVDTALTGEEALSKVKGNGFDVVIADWKMEGMDGLEIAKRVKQENPKIEVIMITGYPSVESSIKAMRTGISDYVPKPFTPEELSEAMNRVLERNKTVSSDLILEHG
ncbi:MAG: response regulator [candidate division Zixibacteria bacterium]|nr:response regulator [candidate division Zixibacteria bacterium]